MNTHRTAAVLMLALLLGFLTFARSQYAQGQSTDQLGTVNFQNSCNPAVQASFQRSVAMLHSFRYGEGEKAFREVLAQDPSCAIATWGIAALLMSNPLAGVGSSPQGAQRAQAAIDEGRKVGAKTQRERDYIEAVAAYYEDWGNRPERTRQANRAKAFETLAARYPSDDEAQIFYALYLAATQSLADQTYATYLKATVILEKEFAKYPDHPGVAHYLIHSYDAPPIAPKGLPAARRYAGIAPSAPHALHMPSHIFTRVGAWSESIATNERSAEAAKQEQDIDEQLHAMDYMVYAELQLARDSDARGVVEAAAAVTGASTRFAGPYAQSAIPARYAVERGDWKQAMTLEPRPSPFPFTVAMTYFARGLGAARSGNGAAADKEAEELGRLRDAMKTAKSEYWAAEIEVSRLATAAWAAQAQGKSDEALGLMRRAADIEDKSEKHIVTPGRLLPARELLGEMLLEQKRPAEALKEF
jgi:tetratricopeptide (TPR) repeat protein